MTIKDRDYDKLTWADYGQIAGVICGVLSVATIALAWQTDRDRKWAATHDRVGDVTIFIDPGTHCRFLVNVAGGAIALNGGFGGGWGERYVAAGTSTTMNSRHLTGHAVDLGVLDANGLLTWDWAYYHPFAVHVKGAAQLCGFPIEWGGDFPTFKDGPHWQLPWDAYPVEKPLPEVREA
jgi:hypothetical protein